VYEIFLASEQVLSVEGNRENTDEEEVVKFAGFRTVPEHPRGWDWIRLKI
jgi:hypothetical protein